MVEKQSGYMVGKHFAFIGQNDVVLYFNYPIFIFYGIINGIQMIDIF